MSTANWLQNLAENQATQGVCLQRSNSTKRHGSDGFATSPRRGQRDVHHNVCLSLMCHLYCAMLYIASEALFWGARSRRFERMANMKAGRS